MTYRLVAGGWWLVGNGQWMVVNSLWLAAHQEPEYSKLAALALAVGRAVPLVQPLLLKSNTSLVWTYGPVPSTACVCEHVLLVYQRAKNHPHGSQHCNIAQGDSTETNGQACTQSDTQGGGKGRTIQLHTHQTPIHANNRNEACQ